MKQPPRFIEGIPVGASSHSRQGVALVIVLSLLVLITVMIVGFLVRVGGERTASASYYAAATTRQLADSAVNLVQAQINEATTTGTGYAWASQPGAIRVFNNTGQLTAIHRLYSASTLVTQTADGSVLKNDVPPANWADSPAVWVDLNAPVTVSSGSADVSGTNDYSVYPILDPRNPSNPGTVDAPIVTATMGGFALSSSVPGATTAQPVPMPVQWLYMLQNGQIVAASGTSSGANTTIKVDGATSANPIIGRIAFWTDDETCKVNINTAAGNLSSRNGSILPSPWDTPRFKIWEELKLYSQNQPIKAEYQRYPGHPASTDLYGIFSALGVTMENYPPVLQNYTSSIQAVASGTQSGLFKLLPRYVDDYGSQGGSANTTKSNTPTAMNNGAAKTDRLYTSIGELLYDPQRNSNGISRQQLESGKFFLTAHSRAPEVTLFGTPRIAVWPIDSDYGSDPTSSNTTKLVSAFDKLIAFCATTGTGSSRHPYYFQRHDSTSPTNDYDLISRNQELYGYLQNLTQLQVPGFGGSLASKYAAENEWNQILTEIVDYIRSTNTWDNSFADTTTPRYTPNTNPGSGYGQVVPLKIGDTRGLGRMYTLSEIGALVICTADGNGKQPGDVGSAGDWRSASNLPVDGTLKTGSGTLTAFSKNPTLADTYGGTGVALTANQKRLQMMLLFELSSPMLGFNVLYPDFSIKISNLKGIKIDGKAPFPSDTAFTDSIGTRYNGILECGGLNEFQYSMSRCEWGSNLRVNGWSNATAAHPYSFVSNPFTVATDATGTGTVSFGGTMTVEIQVKKKGTSTLQTVQTFVVTFPSTTIPIPDLMQNGLKLWNANTSTWDATSSTPSDWWGFDKRISSATSSPSSGGYLHKGCVFRTDTGSPGTPIEGWTGTTVAPIAVQNSSVSATTCADVVRTLITKDGDVRLTMAKETVTADGSTDMVTLPEYDSSTVKLVHMFMQSGASNVMTGCDLGGKLVAGASYSPEITPKVPSNVTPKANWDWDNGLPGCADGAYANKPDEGNTYTNGSSSPYYNGENQTNAANNLASYFTPNRIIPSAVMFGSLPTGVMENISWRTLLFQPQNNHDTLGSPADHLILDLFNMPVVEPYAISEPFSTGGKINMNYQIVPFTYITRNTGVLAVLGSELIARVPKSGAAKNPGNNAAYYKGIPTSSTPVQPGGSGATIARLPLNLSETNGTLKQFEDRFNKWDIFRSASEICDLYLVPKGYALPGFESDWHGDDFAMVGDNVRERPYAGLYPRLTTKSNTYTVHFRVQALKNPSLNAQGEWNESTGVITGEYRGSTTVERYLDPSNSTIPNYPTDASAKSLDTFYQWRTVSNQSFTP